MIDENSIVAQESCDDPEHSDLVSEEAAGNIIAPGRDFVYLEDNAEYVYSLSGNGYTKEEILKKALNRFYPHINY